MTDSGWGPVCNAARCDGTIFRTSMRSRWKYSASSDWFSARCCDTTCRQPPVASAGNTTVLPRSAAIVETVA